MSKCKGCGKILQNEDQKKLGYTPNLKNKLCERCFKIKNYNYHDNNENIMDNEEIINKINKKNACTFFLCDVLSLNNSNILLYKKINNPKVLVVTKVDILPNNLDIEIFRNNIKKTYGITDVLFSSVKNNTIEDRIGSYLNKYSKIVMAGPTSSGKSSLINYLFKEDLTVSHFKNTTLEFINIKSGNQVIIDAPGFNNKNMDNPLRLNGSIKPRTILIKKGYELLLDKYIIIPNNDINICIYAPKLVLSKTRKIRKEYSSVLNIKNKSDIVFDNIGFIYFKYGVDVSINTLEGVDTRESLVAHHE